MDKKSAGEKPAASNRPVRRGRRQACRAGFPLRSQGSTKHLMSRYTLYDAAERFHSEIIRFRFAAAAVPVLFRIGRSGHGAGGRAGSRRKKARPGLAPGPDPCLPDDRGFPEGATWPLSGPGQATLPRCPCGRRSIRPRGVRYPFPYSLPRTSSRSGRQCRKRGWT